MIEPRVADAERDLVRRLLIADQQSPMPSDLGARWQEIAARLYPPPP